MATVKAQLAPDGTVRRHLPDGAVSVVEARTDWAVVDATTEADIARHAAEDDCDGMAGAVS